MDTLYMFHCFSLAILVKIMMSLAIFLSYALQFYVPVELLNPFIQRRLTLNNASYKFLVSSVCRVSPEYHLRAEYCLRIGLVLLTFSLAAAVPKLDLFISLVGSVSR